MIILKIHSLEEGYHDRDQVLLHVAFQVLVDFVEKEEPDKFIDWDFDDHHRHIWSEISSLYKWWKEERPVRHDPSDDLSDEEIPPFEFDEDGFKVKGYKKLKEFDKKKYAKFFETMQKSQILEEQWDEEDQRNLHRLVDIRFYLWT